jgi:hypothetical protein
MKTATNSGPQQQTVCDEHHVPTALLSCVWGQNQRASTRQPVTSLASFRSYSVAMDIADIRHRRNCMTGGTLRAHRENTPTHLSLKRWRTNTPIPIRQTHAQTTVAAVRGWQRTRRTMHCDRFWTTLRVRSRWNNTEMVCGLELASSGSGEGQVGAGYCKHGKEPSRCTKGE